MPVESVQFTNHYAQYTLKILIEQPLSDRRNLAQLCRGVILTATLTPSSISTTSGSFMDPLEANIALILILVHRENERKQHYR